MRETLIALSSRMGITLSERQLEQLETYAKLLVEWNERMNLTAITEPEEIARKHFIDSFAGWELIAEALQKGGDSDPNKTVSLIDVGTGAGFPGIPLKILFPELRLTLLDSLQKRIGFLEEVCRQLELTEVTCIHGRAEDTAHDAAFRESYDFACARAVAALPVLMEYCAGYVRVGGALLAYKGPSLPEEMENSQKAMKVLHLSKTRVIRAEVLGEDYDHYVAVFRKSAPLGLQYPRKQSKIKAMPL